MIETHDLEPVEIYEKDWYIGVPAPSHVCKKCGMYFILINNPVLHVFNTFHRVYTDKSNVFCYWADNNWYCEMDYICSIGKYYSASAVSFDDNPELRVCGAKNMHEALE